MKVLTAQIESAVKDCGYILPDGFQLNSPPSDKFGDYATNVAILIAKKLSLDPRIVAEKIIEKFPKENIEELSIATPGFINIRVKYNVFHQQLASVLSLGSDYAKSDIGKGKKALVEYISANPTGPLHIGNARGGPIGDVIANVLGWLGYHTEREFYLNDVGTQIKKFGRTLAYYYIVKQDTEYPFPEDGYPGDFLKNVSEDIQKEHLEKIQGLKDDELTDFFVHAGLELTIHRIKEDVDLLGINFDRFIYESDFLNSGASEKVVEELKTNDKTTVKEGATWFVSPEYNDLSDRESVLIRSDADKSLTYFANDIAYHKDKFDRGFDRLIDIWGPNHHGHIARLKAAMQSLGYDQDNLSIMLYQNVKLKQGGEVKQMGKRLGNYVNISDLIKELKVPADVFKYTIISQSPSSIIDFDLDLALEQSEKNPVYYLQYAYARICSIIRKAQDNDIAALEKIARGEVSIDTKELEKLTDKKEVRLIKTLNGLPGVLEDISHDFQIQALPHFATEVAKAFHDFYSSCIVLSDDKEQTKSRLLLVLAARNVLKISLTLMGISAPEQM